MIRSFFLLLLSIVPLLAFGQSDRKLDANGKLAYQYQRTFTPPCDTCSEAVVTFMFVNGSQQRAISFRQEAFDTKVRWIDTPSGTVGHEDLVEYVTANLAPNQTVTWTYAISSPKKRVSAPEKAALLIMDEKYGVEKVWLK